MALLGQDVMVLLRLIGESEKPSISRLANDLSLSPSEVQYALRRLDAASLVDIERRRANQRNAREFLIHAVKYIFPAKPGELTRGLPTAMSHESLARLMPPAVGVLADVWSDPDGMVRGQSIQPLHKSAPRAARGNPGLYELLAITDVLRLRSARAVEVASERLTTLMSEQSSHG